ncbi:MAG: branched-chain amino acid aminotransferase [Hymenobacteraceae bacterium]|nr:branched-chain amino acid aminotransferase [Hymenobacteraceae bacterium]
MPVTLTSTLPITIRRATVSRLHEVDFAHIEFGKVFSDHMLTVDFRDGAWQQPVIEPYGPLALSPATSALHYGQAIFEGMKAYRQGDGRVVLFRPLDNLHRLNASAERMCMPALPEEVFMEGLRALINLDRAWVPTAAGTSLYIRPFMFATDAFIGVRPSSDYKFVIFTSPVNAYYSQPLRVRFEYDFVRSPEGGTGYAKAAGNYGGAMEPTRRAQAEGFHQLLWTDAAEHRYIEESGTMNACFVLDGKLVTPAISSSILDGVTRRSVLALARRWGVTVEERRVSCDEILAALQAGTLQEAFGCGTAATIAPIVVIGDRGLEYALPALSPDSLGARLGRALDALKLGTEPDVFGWLEVVE